MTKIAADWLTADASKTVTDMLSDAGHEVYFVGGCVRNALMDRPVADLDLATNARPDVVMKLAQAAGLKVIPTGIDHGTVTVVAGHRPYEITTYRTDIKTDGRHAVIAFSDTMHDDAVRRDFTMNALYCAPDGTVFDPVGGLPDLHAGHVRFINDPGQRIREDYLRILRFFRFTAWYGDPDLGIDADGLAACAAHLDGLDGLAKERVTDEVIKLLSAPDPAPSMAAMSMSGVLLRLLPGADVSALAPLVHIEELLGHPPHCFTRLAALGSCDVKTQLRLSKKATVEYDRIRGGALSGVSPAESGYRLGADLTIEILMLRAAMTGQTVANADIDASSDGEAANFPIAAADLMPVYEGKALGVRIKQLEDAWVASNFAMTKADLLALP